MVFIFAALAQKPQIDLIVPATAGVPPGPPGIAAASLVSIYGQNLASTTATAEEYIPGTNFIPTNYILGGVEVLLNTTGYMGDSDLCHNIPFQLLFVSPNRINAVVPNCSGTSYVSVFQVGTSLSDSTLIKLVNAAPALFTLHNNIAAAIRPCLACIAYYSVVSTSNPAHPGEIISLYATGLGSYIQKCAPGCQQVLANMPQVMIDGIQATVSFAGRAPGYAGLDQINVQVPADAHGGVSVPVIVTSAGRTSNAALLPIE